MENGSINSFFEQNRIQYIQNEIMAEHTTFKIGGAADYYCEPENIEALKLILGYLKENEIPYFIIGNGSNILVSDSGIEGVVISLKNFDYVKSPSAFVIECGAGLKLSKLCTSALELTLSGLEFAWGIPGTVGGAIYMNAGAYNSEISEVLTECTYIDENGQVVQADVSSLELGYRKSIFTNSEKVIVSAKFTLKHDTAQSIKSQMDELMNRRRAKQPLEYPSAGSTFKRPTGYFAGSLIEECGLKGVSIGDAAVSEKHAGFIINTGNATAHDVLSLINKVKDEVFLQKSIELEPEVKIVGR